MSAAPAQGSLPLQLKRNGALHTQNRMTFGATKLVLDGIVGPIDRFGIEQAHDAERELRCREFAPFCELQNRMAKRRRAGDDI